MQIHQEKNGTLELKYDSSGWTKWFYGAAFLFLATAGYDLFISPYKRDRMVALFACAGLCIIGGLLSNEKAFIKVDPSSKTVTWNRRIAFWKKNGALNFNDIDEVLVQKITGTRKAPSKRISLRLKNGNILPLTYSSGPDPGKELDHAAELFRKVLNIV